MTERGGEVAAAFADLFAAAPTAVWSAPGRVNLVGEHTDYNGGLVLPVAIDLRATAAVRPRADGLLRLRSRQRPRGSVDVALADVRAGTPGGWAAYVAGVLAVMQADGLPVAGADVLVDSAVPQGAGLSSSAALECAVAAAIAAAVGLDLTPRQLAALARRAENDVVGVPCGPMDQMVAMLARPETALLLDCSTGEVEQVPFAPRGAGLDLVVVDTRVRHALADGQYAERRHSCERVAAALGVADLSHLDVADLAGVLPRLPDEDTRGACRHVVTENQRVRDVATALRSGDVGAIGPLLSASHASLRDDYRVSCRELDLAVEVLDRAGATGARMTGAGFGGSAIGLVPSGMVTSAATALRQAFTSGGLRSPVVRVVSASGSAQPETTCHG